MKEELLDLYYQLQKLQQLGEDQKINFGEAVAKTILNAVNRDNALEVQKQLNHYLEQ